MAEPDIEKLELILLQWETLYGPSFPRNSKEVTYEEAVRWQNKLVDAGMTHPDIVDSHIVMIGATIFPHTLKRSIAKLKRSYPGMTPTQTKEQPK